MHTALIFNDLTSHEVESILQDLHYQNKKWYFTNTHRAKKIAGLSTYYTQHLWGGPSNVALYTVAGAAIKYALKNKIITDKDLHFSVDEHIVEILKTSKDPVLLKLVTIMQNIDQYYIIANNKNYDVYQPVKMRGFDPLIMQDSKLQRLSELSRDFKADLQATQKHADKGSYIKFININDKNILDLLIAANV